MAASGELRLGLGVSGALGQSWFSEAKACRLIERAYELGVRHFDTAAFYGRGEAERRLGRALAGAEDVYLSTKTGTREDRLGRRSKAFSEEAIRDDLEASLARLQRERIGTLYLHGPDYWIVDHYRPVFEALKAEGRISRGGVCAAGPTLCQAILDQTTDAVMGAYNLFDRRHGGLFTAARARGITTAAIAPLGQGLHRRGLYWPRSPSDAWLLARAVLRKSEALERARRAEVQALHRLGDMSAAGALFRYALSHRAINVVMTTTTRARHLDEAVRIAREAPLPQQRLSDLEALVDGIRDGPLHRCAF